MFAVISFIFRFINRFVAWYRLPFFLSILNVLALRRDLRWRNLYDTSSGNIPVPDKKDFDVRNFRTADGSYNDLGDPTMGMHYMRFGRNVPLPDGDSWGEDGLKVPQKQRKKKRLYLNDGSCIRLRPVGVIMYGVMVLLQKD